VNLEILEAGAHVWFSAVHASPKNIEEFFRLVAEKHPTVSIQVVDLDRVPGHHYLTLAVVNAIHSFRSNHPIGKTLGIELLLYIAGERQITEALKRVGVTPETRRVAVVAVGTPDELSAMPSFLNDLLEGICDDHLLDEWSQTRIENVRSGFKIGEKELRAIARKEEPVTVSIERLAIERSALVAAKK